MKCELAEYSQHQSWEPYAVFIEVYFKMNQFHGPVAAKVEASEHRKYLIIFLPFNKVLQPLLDY